MGWDHVAMHPIPLGLHGLPPQKQNQQHNRQHERVTEKQDKKGLSGGGVTLQVWRLKPPANEKRNRGAKAKPRRRSQ